MYKENDLIDGKYLVEGICSNTGGMGTVLFVASVRNYFPGKMVLKYCKDWTEENLMRFKREVRLLASFKGNSKVVQVFDDNLDHEPPYFVMKYYPDGDLSNLSSPIKDSLVMQENFFLQMIDCVQELHSRNEFHRDIKPQNFLLDGNQVVVSDFGLTTEVGSSTAFTRSSMYWGTHGYIPPEFLNGGFKYADAAGDVFMLGKTFYVLLTKRDPLYLVEDGISPPVFHIIERCCSISKGHRYQTLADLKQSVVSAYDVLLGRSGGVGKVKQLLSAINDRIEQERKYQVHEVVALVEQLALLDDGDQVRVCFEISTEFFGVIRQPPVINSLFSFLSIYEKLVDSQDYAWSYAETIAANMSVIFSGEDVPVSLKAKALDLAIRSALYMNRFAAMDTCKSMVTSVKDETLGLQIAALLLSHPETFIAKIEPSECQSDSIGNALRQLQVAKRDMASSQL